MKEFGMNTQYAGSYGDADRKSFLSINKPLALAGTLVCAASLALTFYVSGKKTSNSLALASTQNIVKETKSASKIAQNQPAKSIELSQTGLEIASFKMAAQLLGLNENATFDFQRKLDLLLLSPSQHLKMIAYEIQKPPALPPITSKMQESIKNALIANSKELDKSKKLNVIEFTITKNLITDLKHAGLSYNLGQELARALSQRLDLRRIRPGANITVLYDQAYQAENQKQLGQILAAKYEARNQLVKVVRFADSDKSALYALDKANKFSKPSKNTGGGGLSILRKPIKRGRISSRFQLRRFHPVLKKYRAHLGVDYAAPTGTPIIATGDGTVSFVGNKGGYGRLVIIKHGKKYSTRYGHMSRFAKIKTGSKVKQGQVIGYVGSSGHASGPHVHYEIRVNGKAKNPLTVALPSTPRHNTPKLAKHNHKAIASEANILFAKMDEIRGRKKIKS